LPDVSPGLTIPNPSRLAAGGKGRNIRAGPDRAFTAGGLERQNAARTLREARHGSFA
jgi:hypothetical protein